jgi:hypothetical protein
MTPVAHVTGVLHRNRDGRNTVETSNGRVLVVTGSRMQACTFCDPDGGPDRPTAVLGKIGVDATHMACGNCWTVLPVTA